MGVRVVPVVKAAVVVRSECLTHRPDRMAKMAHLEVAADGERVS